MIRLETTTRKLQMLLGGAVTTTALDVVASYTDFGNLANRRAITPMKLSRLSGTTPVDIVDAPEANLIREVDSIAVRNNDTATATLTMRFNDNGTTYKILTVAIPTLQTLQYERGIISLIKADGSASK